MVQGIHILQEGWEVTTEWIRNLSSTQRWTLLPLALASLVNPNVSSIQVWPRWLTQDLMGTQVGSDDGGLWRFPRASGYSSPWLCIRRD